MMGHRAKMHGGIELDHLSWAKRFLMHRPGFRPWVKRRHNRRQRKEAARAVNVEVRGVEG